MKKEITFTAKQVGERVKERRTELNLTMPELGKRVGVNKSTIQRYEADGVDPIGGHPAAYLPGQPWQLLLQALGRHGIAGGPVVHIRKERVQRRDACVVVRDALDQEGVEVVLLLIEVGQHRHEGRSVLRFAQLDGIFAQLRRTHADDPLRRHRGRELRREVPVLCILHCKQAHADSRFHPTHAFFLLFGFGGGSSSQMAVKSCSSFARSSRQSTTSMGCAPS